MKNSTILRATLSIMILFSVANATAQNFQLTKKKYVIVKGNNHTAKHIAPAATSLKDSLHHYTDRELIKLANHIKELEKVNSLPNAPNSKKAVEVAGNSSSNKNRSRNQFTDGELIKLVNYIKSLEDAQWNSTTSMVKE